MPDANEERDAIIRKVANWDYCRYHTGRGLGYVRCAICGGQWVLGAAENHRADCFAVAARALVAAEQGAIG